MPRAASPKISKADMGKLTGRQQAVLRRATASVESSKDAVRALRSQRNAHQENVKTLRGHLEKIDEKISAHPLVQKREGKLDEIRIAKQDLSAVLTDLARAQALLQSKINRRDDKIQEMRGELDDNDDGDDQDGDDDDDLF